MKRTRRSRLGQLHCQRLGAPDSGRLRAGLMLEQCATASYGLTLKVMFWSTLLQLVIGLRVAWLLARRSFYGKALLDAVVMLPLIFPPMVLGYVLLLALGRNGWLVQ